MDALLNFTPRAQQALALARKEADRLHHNFVGTEHLLLGLIALGSGVVVTVLTNLGLNLEKARAEVEKQAGLGTQRERSGNIPYTPEVKKVLALAFKEARSLNHAYVGTEHILLGLLAEKDGVAAQVFQSFGVDVEKSRAEMLKELDPGIEAAPIGGVANKGEKLGFFRTFLSKLTGSEADPSWREPMRNFTPRAQQALGLARKEADRFNHNFVGTEHLLLGLIALDQGTAVAVLKKFGLELEAIKLKVEKQVGTGSDQKMIGNIPYTPRVRKVIALASKEARSLNHTYVGTEHILLGMLREGDGVAGRVLKSLGVETERTRLAILKELDPNRGE